MDTIDLTVLDALLDSWDRNHTVLLNLLSLIPPGGLEARAGEGSPTVSQMYMHMHHERMVSVSEEAPELTPRVPEREWASESSSERIAELLSESAEFVRHAVIARTESGRMFERNFAHPVQLISFLIFHEGYHHGQIKLALKATHMPIDDADAGPVVWDVWRSTSFIRP